MSPPRSLSNLVLLVSRRELEEDERSSIGGRLPLNEHVTNGRLPLNEHVKVTVEEPMEKKPTYDALAWRKRKQLNQATKSGASAAPITSAMELARCIREDNHLCVKILTDGWFLSTQRPLRQRKMRWSTAPWSSLQCFTETRHPDIKQLGFSPCLLCWVLELVCSMFLFLFLYVLSTPLWGTYLCMLLYVWVSLSLFNEMRVELSHRFIYKKRIIKGEWCWLDLVMINMYVCRVIYFKSERRNFMQWE